VHVHPDTTDAQIIEGVTKYFAPKFDNFTAWIGNRAGTIRFVEVPEPMLIKRFNVFGAHREDMGR
jgi:hypothetical protein